MSKSMRFNAALLLIVMATMAVAAQNKEPVETPNDPAVNEDANACYTGGSMEGKCDWPTDEETEWAWTCGWYTIRVEAGMFTEAHVPLFCGQFEQISACAVDDVFRNEPGQEVFTVEAPGVLANDLCTATVVGFTDPVVVENGPVNILDFNADGSFSYSVSEPATVFTFTYWLSDGSSATVTVYHDMNLEPN